MLHYRIIPALLLKENGLYKGVQFKDFRYVGDPINAIKIFNTKEVDELMLLDIEASKLNKPINFELIKNIVGECFMPLSVGGGINNINDIEKLINCGVEKVVLNTSAFYKRELISEAANSFGNQAVVVSVDVRNINNKYEVFTHSGTKATGVEPFDLVKSYQDAGAGEIMITSIDHEGMSKGYDINLIQKITEICTIPVIASGGAGSVEDFAKVIIEGKANAATAGSYFVFIGSKKAVLISYPDKIDLETAFGKFS
ncbi:MAG: imidazole glycerol phosphate synthase subunit HisF [Bacteroidetes bacterium GWE2_29_8]|nr:MAG: imidazole glycerol phosphate synthase subunit HisF [Bacteroidetes bacterium GWE2_29_8]OFY24687.1 MAG: imidazole glycerol phosphate synthase subunit HisF [Bacteroidetes bacterium GWF2_29_10]